MQFFGSFWWLTWSSVEEEQNLDFIDEVFDRVLGVRLAHVQTLLVGAVEGLGKRAFHTDAGLTRQLAYLEPVGVGAGGQAADAVHFEPCAAVALLIQLLLVLLSLGLIVLFPLSFLKERRNIVHFSIPGLVLRVVLAPELSEVVNNLVASRCKALR